MTQGLPRTERVRFRRIRTSPLYPVILERIKAGDSPIRLAHWMQEQGEADDVKVSTLIVELCAFRREVAALHLLDRREPKFVKDAKDRAEAAISEIEEIADIYRLQRKRIQRMVRLEKKMGVSNRMVGNEVRIAAELLRSSHAIKMDLGVNGGRDLGTLTLQPGVPPSAVHQTHQTYGDGVARVLDDPQSRQRLLDVVQRGMAVLNAHDVIDAEPGVAADGDPDQQARVKAAGSSQ